MRPTRLRTLALAAVLALPVGWIWVGLWEAAGLGLPDVSWLTAGLLAFLALLLLVVARAAHGWVSERRYDRRMGPLVLFRLLLLAKAGSLCGALVVGAYGGLAVGLREAGVAPIRLLRPGAAVAAGALLLVAALVLERACRVPEDPDASSTP